MEDASGTPQALRHCAYTLILLFIAGMGGFLCGYDIGIIGAALLYLSKTVGLTIAQESMLVAAVVGGGSAACLVAGGLADLIGRKRTMIAAAGLFAASVVLVVAARGFRSLFGGRTLLGLSAGMIAVVVPLYLAECLPAGIRGRGTAAFQLLWTIGILAASAVGAHYAKGAEAVAHAAAAGSGPLRRAQEEAWRGMFRTAIYPALVFLAGSFFVTESPRWLLRRGQASQARAALERSRTPEEAERELREMEESLAAPGRKAAAPAGGLFQRKYVVPFLLTCAVLGLNQATGINSILRFLDVILQQAGLDAAAAARQATLVTAVNVAFTVVGMLLVDRLGRKALLKIGTAGIVLALVVAGVVFARIAPSAATGELVTACLMVFIASFAIGPGVCVWLVLSELMPTRIRSLGMGVGLLVNQGVSFAIAALFLPVVTRYGYGVMFLFWGGCTVGYFLVAALLLPETKGKTLEEIEMAFERGPRKA